MQVVDHVSDLEVDPQRFQRADALLTEWCASGKIPSAGLVIGRDGKTSRTYVWGALRREVDPAPMRDDAIFLVASITKPIVAMGVLLLAERGAFTLDERVETFIPEFGKNGKHAVTIRNLLTHTSGLPDMLPQNVELRAANAGLKDFVRGICEIGLDFLPGRGVQYQSTGFAILGELIERVSGEACAQFLRREFLDPLEMTDSAVGAPDVWFSGESPRVDRIAEVRLPPEQQKAPSWNWNSRYWRQLGVPWGGLLTTPADLGRYCAMMLNWKEFSGKRLLSEASLAAATRNQLEAMREIPADDRRCRPWGLGWRLNWAAHSANFGDLLGPSTYGHWGATGTVMWLDPVKNAFMVLLTTQPQEPTGNYLARISNIVAASLI